jgi:hypothetical protein
VTIRPVRIHKAKVELVSQYLQEIEDAMKIAGVSDHHMVPKIRFPRGFIQTAQLYRDAFPCRRRQIGNNVAYTLQFLDVLRWILIRTDLELTAQQMVVKHGVIGTFSVIEGLLFDALKSRRIEPGKKFRKTLEKARNLGIISDALYGDLSQVHEMREKVHLHLYDLTGARHYDLEDWNFAVAALQHLSNELRE